MAFRMGKQLPLAAVKKTAAIRTKPENKWDKIGVWKEVSAMGNDTVQTIDFDDTQERDKEHISLRLYLSGKSGPEAGYFQVRKLGDRQLVIEKKTSPPKPRGRRNG